MFLIKKKPVYFHFWCNNVVSNMFLQKEPCFSDIEANIKKFLHKKNYRKNIFDLHNMCSESKPEILGMELFGKKHVRQFVEKAHRLIIAIL